VLCCVPYPYPSLHYLCEELSSSGSKHVMYPFEFAVFSFTFARAAYLTC
jgi:hypothetical protein